MLIHDYHRNAEEEFGFKKINQQQSRNNKKEQVRAFSCLQTVR